MLPTTIMLLSTLLGPPGPGGAATPEPASTAVPELLPERGPRMRLSRGFAEVVHEAGRTFWRSPVERAYLEPEGHLELGALGDLDLAWSGRGSLHLEGPGALQWTRGAFSGDGSLELFDFRSADLEVRSGGLALDLPGGVRLDMRRGAVQLVSGPAGRYLVHHLGGEAMDLAHPAPGPRGADRPNKRRNPAAAPHQPP